MVMKDGSIEEARESHGRRRAGDTGARLSMSSAPSFTTLCAQLTVERIFDTSTPQSPPYPLISSANRVISLSCRRLNMAVFFLQETFSHVRHFSFAPPSFSLGHAGHRTRCQRYTSPERI